MDDNKGLPPWLSCWDKLWRVSSCWAEVHQIDSNIIQIVLQLDLQILCPCTDRVTPSPGRRFNSSCQRFDTSCSAINHSLPFPSNISSTAWQWVAEAREGRNLTRVCACASTNAMLPRFGHKVNQAPWAIAAAWMRWRILRHHGSHMQRSCIVKAVGGWIWLVSNNNLNSWTTDYRHLYTCHWEGEARVYFSSWAFQLGLLDGVGSLIRRP